MRVCVAIVIVVGDSKGGILERVITRLGFVVAAAVLVLVGERWRARMRAREAWWGVRGARRTDSVFIA